MSSPRTIRGFLLSLLLATAAALLWNAYGMTDVLVVDGRTPYAVSAVDDRDEINHGASVGAAYRRGDALELDCRIVKQFAYPFCELQVRFGAPPGGIDLSHYDSLRVRLRSEGPEADRRLRLFLRQYNPAYTRRGDDNSYKVNELVIDPGPAGEEVEIPLNRVAVADWWLDSHPMPMALSGVELDHVIDLGVSTGSAVVDGAHRVRIERIEFRGKWIAPATFRLLVIGLWMACLLAWLVADAVASRRKVRHFAALQHELTDANESLRLQTRRLARRAFEDPLTGLLNRAGLEGALEQLGASGDGGLFPASLMFMDIDHFKRINDEHGHPIGDLVLQEVARLVRERVQRTDLVARWGGEEFLIACPGTAGPQALGIALRLRAALAGAACAEGIAVTCSFGLAEWHGGEPLADAVARADQAMYRAKREGRDRVEVQWPAEAAREP
jgi:diguanylate cyclase (GGDEF)-like protein